MKKSNFFVNVKTKFSSLFQKNKKLFILLVVLVCILLFCMIFYPKSAKSESDTDVKSELNTDVSASDYASSIENKIQSMLLSVDEIKKASVMVLCESTIINDYLKDKSETKNADGSTTYSEETAYEKNSSNTSPIIISSKMPKIVGVWVIINEVSPSTKLAITNSISSVLNLNETSISILQER